MRNPIDFEARKATGMYDGKGGSCKYFCHERGANGRCNLYSYDDDVICGDDRRRHCTASKRGCAGYEVETRREVQNA